MNLASALCDTNASNEKSFHQAVMLKFSEKNEHKILKIILLGHLYRLFCELFQEKIYNNRNSMEYYEMDNKIIQLFIQGIVETGEYTLEGIALYTRIPLDVIFDAACGVGNQFSITPWAKVVDLYLQVRPDIAQLLMDKLCEIRDKNRVALSLLLK